jgi:adenylosuccinate synthase
VSVNGLDGLALTKLDVLTGLDEVKACVAYDTPHGRTTELPIDDLDRATPVYESFAGWTEDLAAARALKDLPSASRRYIEFIEKQAGAPLVLVSVGSRREETIVLRDPFRTPRR